MAPRPIWRGHLRLALVSCPVALYSAVRESSSLHFHFINPSTGHRVRMATLDAENDEELSRRDLVRGYEFERDRYVILDDEDFESARVPSSSTLNIVKFVDRASIDPIYHDTSYHLVPDGDTGVDVFVVLRDAIATSGMAALSRVVIARRERPVVIFSAGRGMVCHTLHEPRDLADPEPLLADVPRQKPAADMVKLATQLIERQHGRFEPADTEDRYETRLRELIKAKLEGEGITPEEPEEPEGGNVIDLMAALKASLGEDRQRTRKAPAKPASASKSRRRGRSAA